MRIISKDSKMPLFAGPCVIEDEGLLLEVAQELKAQLAGLNVDFYFKSSFDKANRTSIDGFRGPGMKKGLEMLSRVKSKVGVSLFTDFHSVDQAEAVADVVDVLQIPAFLCRQTDLVVAGAQAALKFGKKLNIKKGQFLAPWDCKNIVEKVRAVQAQSSHKQAEPWFYLTERGSSFGYNTLVVDMTSFHEIQKFCVPVIYDATHSVQKPGAGADGKSTGGNREHIEVLARAAMAAGADGIFMETHPRPEKAMSDGPNAFPLLKVRELVSTLLEIRKL
jgi:2-dehydro-3-deoxyphosphooctonate aldolase (KDO 8-P synthase)